MPRTLEHQEGGWAWAVLLASMLSQGLTLGFPTCTGVFFTQLQHDFQASNSETSWFPSILTAVLHAGGPLCSILVGRFGCRSTVMLGGILACLGMVTSSFSRTLSQLYITAGLITGLGMCFSFQASITVLGYYFSRRRALANALASVGVSLGITLWPLLSRYLLEDLGWRGTFFIFGGILLHCCVSGAVLSLAAHRTHLFILAVLLNGLTNLVCVASADFGVLVGYCLVYSVSMSGIGALLFQVLMDIVPTDRFSSALGLFTVLESISILIAPPVAALFMGTSFCVLQKKERQGRQAEVGGASAEQDLTPEGPESSKKQLCPEIMYVTSL
ncbi:monocarboxylate transporter 6 [Echinops telfairi]|uniref:Monocarboxylate transporter 6 n=1 Tax=Echinops telfairi TaxID=9371 RepID=A0AC55DUL0_ECHTE|nr:monocarboxylate transporter 6 [Echinops telfairi]